VDLAVEATLQLEKAEAQVVNHLGVKQHLALAQVTELTEVAEVVAEAPVLSLVVAGLLVAIRPWLLLMDRPILEQVAAEVAGTVIHLEQVPMAVMEQTAYV
jgi:hypothetical protein